MKNNYLYNWVVIVFMMLQMLAFTSCSDDDDNSGWPTETDKTEIFIERFSTLVTNLTALRDGATYGELKDNYPVSSKEVRDGIPVMTKIYVNGQLMLSERGRDDRLPYTPNDKEVAMVAFTGLSATANRIGEKSTNGCMRHLHIWKSAKTQAEIQHLMDTPESVTGSESDLVCGWTLNKTVSDNNNIKDLTGKFSARLIGDFQWVENR